MSSIYSQTAASTPGNRFSPLFPAKSEPEGSEPESATVEPILGEEEVCANASQAIEATCVHEQICSV